MIHVIPQSELILNADGSVYHLNLHPEDVADTIVFVGDPDRVQEVSKHFDNIELMKGKREFITHTGFVGNKRISVISTGIGTDNIDIVLNEIDILKNVDLKTRLIKPNQTKCEIYRVGTSGALQTDVAVDSILISTHAIGLDGLLHYYKASNDIDIENHISAQLNYPFINPYFINGSEHLIQKFDDTFLRGVTATCVGFYAPQGRKIRKDIVSDKLIKRLSELKINTSTNPNLRVTNFEMETAAIYGLSNLFGFEAVSINAILANRMTNTFSKKGAETIEKAIIKTLEIICNH